MPMNPDDVVRVLERADNPADRWSSVADALRSHLDAASVRIMAFCPKTNERYVDAVTFEWPARLIQEYDAHYFDSDPRIAAASARLGKSVSCIEVVDSREFEMSPLVCDFLDRPEVCARWGLLHIARSSAGHMLLFGAARSRREGPFVQEDKDRFDAVLAPIKRALDFDARLAVVAKKREVLEATLDVLANPIIVLSQSMRVVHLNARAEELLSGKNGLRVIRGRLSAVRPEDQAGLERIVGYATGNENGRTPQAAVISLEDGPFLLMRAYRLPRAAVLSTADGSNQCALVFTTIGSRPVDHGVDAVLKAFGLTAAELKLVRQLLLGARLPEVAAGAGVSIETVRSQLKNAREKIGVRRQSDLIRFLSQYG